MQKVSIWKKLHVIYNFFFARRIISHVVTFFFYCVVIPLSAFFPEVEIPKWGMVYVPATITLLNSVGTPRFATSNCFPVFNLIHFIFIMRKHCPCFSWSSIRTASRLNWVEVQLDLGQLQVKIFRSRSKSSFSLSGSNLISSRKGLVDSLQGIHTPSSFKLILSSWIFPAQVS